MEDIAPPQHHDTTHYTDDADSALRQITNDIIGCAIRVHKEIGPGFPESVYQRAMEIELTDSKVDFTASQSHPVLYKNQSLGQIDTDLIVSSTVLVEIKSVETLLPMHAQQVMSYLRVSKLPLALLINFNVPRLVDGVRRVSLTRRR